MMLERLLEATGAILRNAFPGGSRRSSIDPQLFIPGLNWVLLACALGMGCAHSELNADEHRFAASQEEAKAARARARFDPSATFELPPSGPREQGTHGLETYNPTAGHLAEADAHLRAAHSHVEKAEALERFEDEHCVGLSRAERASCPLFTAFVERVEETPDGLRLHLKAGAPEQKLLEQMQCHLAFAQVHGVERAPCPLYLRGVTIADKRDHVIELGTNSRAVAEELRSQGRLLFGKQ